MPNGCAETYLCFPRREGPILVSSGFYSLYIYFTNPRQLFLHSVAPRASCAPNTYTGRIQVQSASSGGVLGNIVDWSLSSLNFLGPDSDLIVQLTVPATSEAIEIIPLNDSGASSAFPFFGAIGGSNPLEPGSTRCDTLNFCSLRLLRISNSLRFAAPRA